MNENKAWNPVAPKAPILAGREAAVPAAAFPSKESAEVGKKNDAAGPVSPRKAISLTDFSGVKRDMDEEKDYLYVPPELVPDGIVVEWKRTAIFNKPDRTHSANIYRGGWRAVPSDSEGFKQHFASFVNGDVIENEGLLLCYRPRTMTDAAKKEEARKAGSLVKDKMAEIGLETGHRDIPGKRFQLERGFEDAIPGGNPEAMPVPE